MTANKFKSSEGKLGGINQKEIYNIDIKKRFNYWEKFDMFMTLRQKLYIFL